MKTTHRRLFLGAVGAGVLGSGTRATVALDECVAAADRRPLELLVVTDTHLGYRDQESARRQWEATSLELAQAPGERIVHLGDVVDGGREPQYAIYKEIRDQIGKPVHEIPGNHDPPELFARHLRAEIDTVVDHAWLRLLLLNDSRPESHDGFLSSQQLDWIDRQCATAARPAARHPVPAHSGS